MNSYTAVFVAYIINRPIIKIIRMIALFSIRLSINIRILLFDKEIECLCQSRFT